MEEHKQDAKEPKDEAGSQDIAATRAVVEAARALASVFWPTGAMSLTEAENRYDLVVALRQSLSTPDPEETG